VNPCVQLQANDPGVLTQMPLCSHGDPVLFIVVDVRNVCEMYFNIHVTLIAFINVFRTIGSFIALSTRTSCGAINWARFTNGISMARI